MRHCVDRDAWAGASSAPWIARVTTASDRIAALMPFPSLLTGAPQSAEPRPTTPTRAAFSTAPSDCRLESPKSYSKGAKVVALVQSTQVFPVVWRNGERVVARISIPVKVTDHNDD